MQFQIKGRTLPHKLMITFHLLLIPQLLYNRPNLVILVQPDQYIRIAHDPHIGFRIQLLHQNALHRHIADSIGFKGIHQLPQRLLLPIIHQYALIGNCAQFLHLRQIRLNATISSAVENQVANLMVLDPRHRLFQCKPLWQSHIFACDGAVDQSQDSLLQRIAHTFSFHAVNSSRTYCKLSSFCCTCSTFRSCVLLELNSRKVLRLASPSFTYLS